MDGKPHDMTYFCLWSDRLDAPLSIGVNSCDPKKGTYVKFNLERPFYPRLSIYHDNRAPISPEELKVKETHRANEKPPRTIGLVPIHMLTLSDIPEKPKLPVSQDPETIQLVLGDEDEEPEIPVLIGTDEPEIKKDEVLSEAEKARLYEIQTNAVNDSDVSSDESDQDSLDLEQGQKYDNDVELSSESSEEYVPKTFDQAFDAAPEEFETKVGELGNILIILKKSQEHRAFCLAGVILKSDHPAK